MNVLVAGATGLIGSHLVALLEKDPAIQKIHILTRKDWTQSSQKIVCHPANYKGGLSNALNGVQVETVFCTLGTTMKKSGSSEAFRAVDHDAVVELAQWCKANGVPTFIVVSSLGANAESKIFYNRVKGEMEQSIKKIGIKRTIIVRPSLLLGSREEIRYGEVLGELAFSVINPLMVGPLKKYSGIHASKVAEAMFMLSKKQEPGFLIIENNTLLEMCGG